VTEPLSGLEFQSELGRGSMGQVVLARQLPSGRLVAVKRLCETGALSGTQQGRLRREAKALARLDDPHVVRLLQLLEVGEALLLVLEYIDGPSLAQLLAQGPIRESDAMAVLDQVQAALSHAHRLGVLHRDVKASNVIISQQGICKLTDFGLARLDDIAGNAARTLLTRPGTPLGTAPYMSPEAVNGDVDLDERSDIYSLGILAYELLVGRLPFPPERGTMALLNAHLSEPVPRPSVLVPGFPLGVEAALLGALEKDRKERIPSASVFWATLDEAAARAWPAWREDADLVTLAARGRSARRPAAGDADTDDPLESLGLGQLERIRPTFPDLGPRRRGVAWVRWALVGLAAALAITLLIQAAVR
jgi:serine/threonine protein kinase